MIRNERQAIVDVKHIEHWFEDLMEYVLYTGMFLCFCLLVFGGLVSCAKPTTRTDTPLPVAAVGVTPYDMVSPFVCRQTITDITCMATVEVRFRRGATETTIPRGHQFTFTTPKGQGKGIVWFGCAGANSCPGYFMFASDTVTVTPIEPARSWAAPKGYAIPLTSTPILDVDVNSNQFVQIRNRWPGVIVPPTLKAGEGITIACTDDACTISAAK